MNMRAQTPNPQASRRGGRRVHWAAATAGQGGVEGRGAQKGSPPPPPPAPTGCHAGRAAMAHTRQARPPSTPWQSTRFHAAGRTPPAAPAPSWQLQHHAAKPPPIWIGRVGMMMVHAKSSATRPSAAGKHGCLDAASTEPAGGRAGATKPHTQVRYVRTTIDFGAGLHVKNPPLAARPGCRATQDVRTRHRPGTHPNGQPNRYYYYAPQSTTSDTQSEGRGPRGQGG